MSPRVTLIWSVRNTVHANIIWISKLVPVLWWNTEQALDNLERKKNPECWSEITIKSNLDTTVLLTGGPAFYFTFGCLLVSCRMVMGSGSGTAWPTRVGPNTLARFLTSILVSMLSETLGGGGKTNEDVGDTYTFWKFRHSFWLTVWRWPCRQLEQLTELTSADGPSDRLKCLCWVEAAHWRPDTSWPDCFHRPRFLEKRKNPDDAISPKISATYWQQCSVFLGLTGCFNEGFVELEGEQWLWEFPEEILEDTCYDIDVLYFAERR